MEHLSNLIPSGSIPHGVDRIKYLPYKMDIALSVVERIGRSFDKNFQIIEPVRSIYEDVIRYFHGDPFYSGDLKKGLLLQGPTGTGKTRMLEIMKRYREIDDIKYIFSGRVYKMNYEIIEVNTIINSFIKDAFEGIDPLCSRYVLAIDDIGNETDKAKHYGNELDVIGYILAERYSRRLLTFGTTNLTLTELSDKYGDRITSRMHAMFNFHIVNTIDFRKQKTA